MADVIMPRLSDSMTEGTIVRWLKSDGDEVTRGEEIVEIETDKATMAYESDFSGTLVVREPEGAVVAVGSVIASVGAAGEMPAQPERSADMAPVAAVSQAATPSPQSVSSPPGNQTSPTDRLAPNGDSADGRETGGRSKASPLARRVARQLGVELSSVAGSGPYSRILKSDVIAVADARTLEAAGSVATPPSAPATYANHQEELTRAQRLIARRMALSRSTIPEFALEVQVDMSGALHLRGELKALADRPPSLTDIIVRACALALRRHPRANGSFSEERFLLNPRINVAVAVAVEGSLLTPVVTDADTKSLGAIAQETRGLIERARAGRILPSELEGGTFTVSNLGMFGIDRFEGIINAPQSAILCVGAVRDRPVAVDGQVVIRPIASMTLACDHRILYGADAAGFLGEVRQLLERPLAMAL